MYKEDCGINKGVVSEVNRGVTKDYFIVCVCVASIILDEAEMDVGAYMVSMV